MSPNPHNNEPRVKVASIADTSESVVRNAMIAVGLVVLGLVLLLNIGAASGT